MRIKRLLIASLLVIALAMIPAVAFAQEGEPQPILVVDTATTNPVIAMAADITQIPATFLELLLKIGDPLVIGIAVSLLIREWKWLAKQSPSRKNFIVFLVCVSMPIASVALIKYIPPKAMAFIEEWWPLVRIGVAQYIASQVWHGFTKNKIRQVPTNLLPINSARGKADPRNGVNMPA